MQKINKFGNFFFGNFCLGLLLSLLFFTTIFPSLNISPIVTRGEGREGQVVQAMQRTGNLILPLRNETTVPSKPPLFHWISYEISSLYDDINPLTLRAPSIICASILLLTCFISVSYFSDIYHAILVTLLTATSLEFLRYSTQARVDMVFSCSISAALYSIYSYLQTNRKLFAVISSLFLALSILAKGPFGLIIPSIIITTYLIIKRDLHFNHKSLSLLIIFTVSLVIGSIWYFLAYKELGQQFLDMQFFKENMSRVVKSDSDELGHSKPIYYSLIYLLQVLMPWSLFFPRLIASFSKYKFIEECKKDNFLLFSLIWVGVFIFAVTVSVSKRSVYFLPIIAPIYFIIVRILELGKERLIPKVLKIYESALILISFLLISLMICACILSIFLRIPIESKYSLHFEIIKNLFNSYGALISLTLIFILLLRFYKYLNAKDLFEKIVAISTLTFCIFLTGQYLIAPKILATDDPRSFVLEVEKITEGKHIYQYDDEYYAPVFYFNKAVPIKDLQSLENKNNEFLLVAESKIKDLVDSHLVVEIMLKSEKNLANRHDKLVLVKITS